MGGESFRNYGTATIILLGMGLTDLLMTVTRRNCLCSGMHPSSIEKEERDSSICFVNENIEKGGWG